MCSLIIYLFIFYGVPMYHGIYACLTLKKTKVLIFACLLSCLLSTQSSLMLEAEAPFCRTISNHSWRNWALGLIKQYLQFHANLFLIVIFSSWKKKKQCIFERCNAFSLWTLKKKKKKKTQKTIKKLKKSNREKKPIKPFKILKKPTGTVWFWFYKPKTEKT